MGSVTLERDDDDDDDDAWGKIEGGDDVENNEKEWKNRPYALTSSSRHLIGKTATKQSIRTDLYARRTVLANEKPPFDL